MSEEKPRYRKISVTIPESDYDWIQLHKEINVSGMVQKCIKQMREKIGNGDSR